MIQLGTAGLALRLGGGAEWVERGMRLLRHVLRFHVNPGNQVDLQEGDLWEEIDRNGAPLRENGVIVSNPGHSIEFVGLGLRFLHAARQYASQSESLRAEMAAIANTLPVILRRSFQNGYCRAHGGIYTTFDLLGRAPLNAYMPWWSLPETIRAAAYVWAGDPEGEAGQEALRILSAAHNAFASHYVRPELHLMAYQNRSPQGRPERVIPATADADPGYHTGCSILDFLSLVQNAD